MKDNHSQLVYIDDNTSKLTSKHDVSENSKFLVYKSVNHCIELDQLIDNTKFRLSQNQKLSYENKNDISQKLLSLVQFKKLAIKIDLNAAESAFNSIKRVHITQFIKYIFDDKFVSRIVKLIDYIFEDLEFVIEVINSEKRNYIEKLFLVSVIFNFQDDRFKYSYLTIDNNTRLMFERIINDFSRIISNSLINDYKYTLLISMMINRIFLFHLMGTKAFETFDKILLHRTQVPTISNFKNLGLFLSIIYFSRLHSCMNQVYNNAIKKFENPNINLKIQFFLNTFSKLFIDSINISKNESLNVEFTDPTLLRIILCICLHNFDKTDQLKANIKHIFDNYSLETIDILSGSNTDFVEINLSVKIIKEILDEKNTITFDKNIYLNNTRKFPLKTAYNLFQCIERIKGEIESCELNPDFSIEFRRIAETIDVKYEWNDVDRYAIIKQTCKVDLISIIEQYIFDLTDTIKFIFEAQKNFKNVGIMTLATLPDFISKFIDVSTKIKFYEKELINQLLELEFNEMRLEIEILIKPLSLLFLLKFVLDLCTKYLEQHLIIDFQEIKSTYKFFDIIRDKETSLQSRMRLCFILHTIMIDLIGISKQKYNFKWIQKLFKSNTHKIFIIDICESIESIFENEISTISMANPLNISIFQTLIGILDLLYESLIITLLKLSPIFEINRKFLNQFIIKTESMLLNSQDHLSCSMLTEKKNKLTNIITMLDVKIAKFPCFV